MSIISLAFYFCALPSKARMKCLRAILSPAPVPKIPCQTRGRKEEIQGLGGERREFWERVKKGEKEGILCCCELCSMMYRVVHKIFTFIFSQTVRFWGLKEEWIWIFFYINSYWNWISTMLIYILDHPVLWWTDCTRG